MSHKPPISSDSPEGQPPSFETLVRTAFDGHLTELEFEQLQEELSRNKASRMFYLDYASVHTLLIQEFDETNRVPIWEEGRSGTWDKLVWVISGMILCACLFLVVFAVNQRPQALPAIAEKAVTPVPVAPVNEPAPVLPVAGLKQLVPQNFGSTGASTGLPPQFMPGEIIRIEQELAHFQFSSGAEVILQGPGAIRMITPLRCELLEGLLTCDVPDSALGFTVQIPGGDVVDQGTAFGVALIDGQKSDVSVFQGRVQTFSVDDDGGSQTGPELTQGMSVQMDERERIWNKVVFAPQRYSRPLGYSQGVVRCSANVVYQAQPPASLLMGAFEDAEHVRLIAEQRNFTWPANLKVDRARHQNTDVSPAGEESTSEVSGISIETDIARNEPPASESPEKVEGLASFLLHYDPPGSPLVPNYDSTETSPYDREGTVTFAGPIVGLIWRQETLQSTDGICGLPNVTYMSGVGRHRTLSKGSTIEVLPDTRTLKFRFLSRKEGELGLEGVDELRVIVDLRSGAEPEDRSSQQPQR